MKFSESKVRPHSNGVSNGQVLALNCLKVHSWEHSSPGAHVIPSPLIVTARVAGAKAATRATRAMEERIVVIL